MNRSMATSEDRRRRLESAAGARGVEWRRRLYMLLLFVLFAAAFLQMNPLYLLSGAGASEASQLAGRPGAAGGGGSHLFNYIYELASLSMLVLFAATGRDRLRYLAIIWPIYIYIVWSGLSSLVGDDKSWSIKSLGTFVLSCGTMMAISYRLSPLSAARIALYNLIFCCFVSAALAIAIPKIGVMGAGDLYGDDNSAGMWRGMFAHKNTLGQVAGLSTCLTLVFGRKILFPSSLSPQVRNLLWVICLGVSLLCIYKSRSSTGILIAIVVPMIYWAIIYPKGPWRYPAIAASVIVLAVCLALKDVIAVEVLSAFGKKEDLSGRTQIWAYADYMSTGHIYLGHGFNYTGSDEFKNRLLSLFSVAYIHNDYIDTVANIGVIGLITLIAMPVCAGIAAWSKPVMPNTSRGLTLARNFFTLVTFTWFISAWTETTNGPLLQLFLIGLFGLWGCQLHWASDGRRASFDRPPPRRRR